MPRDQRYSFYLPRPRGATAWILTINIVCFFLAIIIGRFSSTLRPYVEEVALQPVALFFHGHIWQVFTYSVLDPGVLSIAFSSLMIWQLGVTFGSRRFLEVYFLSLVGGGLLGSALSYTRFIGIGPEQLIFTAWPGILGLVAYRGTAFAKENCCLFGMPISSRNMAFIWIGLEIAFLLATGQLLYVAGLGGALTGFAYAKALPRRGLKYAASERYFGVRNTIRNAYYRWKRRRATRKFEVYMRKHDRTVYFDQYGNYIHPEDQGDKGKDEPGPGGWVN